MIFRKVLIFVVLGFMATGCATVTKGTEDEVEFTSDPDGAVATITDVRGKFADQSCVTPCEMKLSRKGTFDVTFEKEGYDPQVLRLEPSISGTGVAGMAGNVLIGGVVGAAIDGATGAMNDLGPNPMNAVLLPEGSGGVDPYAAPEAPEAGTSDEEAPEDEADGDGGGTEAPTAEEIPPPEEDVVSE